MTGLPSDRNPPAAPARHAESAGNPYAGKVEAVAAAAAAAAPAPDLDAAAPYLHPAEARRLNRKALVFLVLILCLVLAMGALTWSKLRGSGPGPVPVREITRTATPPLPGLPSAPAQPVPQQPAMAIPLAAAPPLPAARSPDGALPVLQEPAPLSLRERRIRAAAATAASAAAASARTTGSASEGYADALRAAMAISGAGQPAAPARRAGPDVDDVASARTLHNPDTLLVRGTYLRCVLETRIVTDVAGFTSCLLTEPVYSVNGRTLLLPKGSKVLGSYGGGPAGRRVSVIWDRITTPNGLDVAMSSPGVDALGGAGHPGEYSAHWGARVTSALMISLLSDAFKYAAAEHGPAGTTIGQGGVVSQTPYESATARTVERLAVDALSQKRPPTVRIQQGTVVNVYVAKDVDFSAVLPAARR